MRGDVAYNCQLDLAAPETRLAIVPSCPVCITGQAELI
jgi:hypothetical protein